MVEVQLGYRRASLHVTVYNKVWCVGRGWKLDRRLQDSVKLGPAQALSDVWGTI
jgi:hypothetical protein